MHSDIRERLASHQEELSSLCSRLDVKELSVFGSATAERFDPSSSDVDFLATFNRSDAPGIADRYMELAEGLEALFNRPVDLLTPPSLQNPVFKKIVDETRQQIYAGEG